MTKINHEEYEVLKSLRDSWRWIARDNDTILWVYEKEPRKHGYRWDDLSGVHGYYWDEPSGVCESVDSDSFQFIQWGDKNPFSIAELVEGYEREETEVKRDIEWAIQEIEGLETEPSQNYPHDEMIEREIVLGILSQLDEPEILSPEWIRGNVEYAHYMTPRGTYSSAKAVIAPDKLKGILVPKQELPVIPHFVAEYLDFAKSDVPLMRVMELANTRNEWPKWEKEYDWISANDETFARAWLDGFTVADKEEEQKYYALIKGHEKIGSDDKYWNYCITDESLDIGDNKVHTDVLAEYVLNATKDEWKALGINEDNADFVEVEELEE